MNAQVPEFELAREMIAARKQAGLTPDAWRCGRTHGYDPQRPVKFRQLPVIDEQHLRVC